MTAALALVPDTEPCPVCKGDPFALFQVMPWGFHVPALAGCPLCLAREDACLVWRRVLGPFLGEETT